MVQCGSSSSVAFDKFPPTPPTELGIPASARNMIDLTPSLPHSNQRPYKDFLDNEYRHLRC
jgi:hypothetical protein